MSNAFVDAVRQRMEGVAASLAGGTATGFEISGADGLRLSVYRQPDGAMARVCMTGTTEVYFLSVGGAYTDVRTAYNDEDKWDVLDEFFECVVAFVEGDCQEEIRKLNGRVVSRVIRLNVPDGPYTISARGGWRGGIGRLLGYRRGLFVRSSRPDSGNARSACRRRT
jgi:hypothetical protein